MNVGKLFNLNLMLNKRRFIMKYNTSSSLHLSEVNFIINNRFDKCKLTNGTHTHTHTHTEQKCERRKCTGLVSLPPLTSAKGGLRRSSPTDGRAD